MGSRKIKIIFKNLVCPKCGNMDFDIFDFNKNIDYPCPKCGNSFIVKNNYLLKKMLSNFCSIINEVEKTLENYTATITLLIEISEDYESMLITSTEKYISNDETSIIEQKINLLNSAWLESKLMLAKKESKIKNIECVDIETLKYLIYGFNFNDDCLSYFFNCPKEQLCKIKKDNNISTKGIYYLSFKFVYRGIYDVQKILQNCLN